MGVFVKGMEMPKSCSVCRFNSGCSDCEGRENFCGACSGDIDRPLFIGQTWNELDAAYAQSKGIEVEYTPRDRRHDKCPLVEVPTPHGNLIDVDAIDRWKLFMNGWNQSGVWIRFGDVEKCLDGQPVILEAEE